MPSQPSPDSYIHAMVWDTGTGDGGNRAVYGLIWSCLVTIFGCTYLAVHPNLPNRTAKSARWKRTLRRPILMLWTIVVPELMLYCAVIQWAIARNVAKRQARKGWTNTHGFFLLMGGFVQGDTLKRLTMDSVGYVDWPDISVEDIEDKSKGDGLSKGLLTLQLLWFILQLISRVVQGFAVTELELMTVAYVVLAVVMMFFWWEKPLNVQRPIHIQTRISSKRPEHRQLHDPPILIKWHYYLTGETDDCAAWSAAEALWQIGIIGAIFGTFFGAIHIIAWNFHFATRGEQLIWRGASIIVTIAPPIYVVYPMIVESFPQRLFRAGHLCHLGLAIIYFLARAFILIDVFVLLRDLPASAYQSSDWTQLIPHI
ncbi:hypothetical protein HGRIS_000320 [Hohenbuehelia grisea]|uniref:Uncharacterized protein n=1 Tax=Hohenbuehelia grisea TaxID=104357 RepID=A0ABR3JQU8_9AGAR